MPMSLRFRAENLTWRSPDDFSVEIISALRFRFRLEITLPLWNSYGLLMSNEIFWGSASQCSIKTVRKSESVTEKAVG